MAPRPRSPSPLRIRFTGALLGAAIPAGMAAVGATNLDALVVPLIGALVGIPVGALVGWWRAPTMHAAPAPRDVIAAGTGTIAGGAIGGSLGISAIGLAVAESPRAAAVGGALVGFGGSWLVLFGRVLVMCDAGCVPPDLRPWLAIGAALAGLGALATFRTRRRP